MQKKLLALAVAAAISAPAFAADDSKVAVSVYGILDVGYGTASKTVTNSATNGNPGGTAKYDQSALQFSALTSSRLGFLATEEMGGGIKAAVRVETGISSNPMAGYSQTGYTTAGTVTTTLVPTIVAGALVNVVTPQSVGANGTTLDATTLGNRELNLSLAFAEGTTVKAGYGSTPIRDISLGYAADPGGNLVGNILNNDATLGSNRVVSLDATQQFTPALKATASLVKDKTSTTTNNPTTGAASTTSTDKNGYQLAAQYAEGALSVSGAYQNLKTGGPNTNNGATQATANSSTKILILGASYDLGVAKLFGEHASIKDDGSTSSTVLATGVTTAQPLLAGNGSRTYTSLGVQAPFGPVMGFAQLSTGTVSRVTTAGTAADSRKITGSTIGAKYNMSKATYAYASLGQANLKAGAVDPAAAGVKVSQFALGLVHTF